MNWMKEMGVRWLRLALGLMAGMLFVGGSAWAGQEHTWRHGGSVTAAAFSPDGRRVLTGSHDKTAVLRDAQTGQTLHTWQHDDYVTSVAFSPDGRRVLTGSADRTAVLRDAQTGADLHFWPHDNIVGAVAFSPDGRRVLIGSVDQTAVLRDARTGSVLHTWRHDHSVTAVVFSPDSKRVLTGSVDKTAVLRDAETGASLHTWWYDSYVWAVAFSPDGRRVLTGLDDGTAVLHDAKTGATLQTWRHDGYVNAVAFSPDGHRVLTGALDKTAVLRDADTGVTLHTWWHDWSVSAVAFSPDGRRVLTGSGEKIAVRRNVPASLTEAVSTAAALPGTLPPAAPIRVSPADDDPELARLERDLVEKKRAKVEAEARAARKDQLRKELAELDKTAPARFDEDLATALSAAPQAKPDRRLHVLAIGINDYADVPDVPYADRSAQAFVDFAKKRLGAKDENIILLTDAEATSGRLRRMLKTMLGRLTSEDRLLVYYAGHGVPAQDGKSAYLLGQDGGAGGYEEPDLQLDTIYAQIDKSRVGQASLFIDACFSGRSSKDSLVFEGVAGITLVPRHGIRPDSRLTVLTAGRSHQFSNQDKTHGHRLFGYHLMKTLLEDGPNQTASTLHSKVRERVLQDSRRIGPEFEQEPELLGNVKSVVGR